MFECWKLQILTNKFLYWFDTFKVINNVLEKKYVNRKLCMYTMWMVSFTCTVWLALNKRTQRNPRTSLAKSSFLVARCGKHLLIESFLSKKFCMLAIHLRCLKTNYLFSKTILHGLYSKLKNWQIQKTTKMKMFFRGHSKCFFRGHSKCVQ